MIIKHAGNKRTQHQPTRKLLPPPQLLRHRIDLFEFVKLPKFKLESVYHHQPTVVTMVNDDSIFSLTRREPQGSRYRGECNKRKRRDEQIIAHSDQGSCLFGT